MHLSPSRGQVELLIKKKKVNHIHFHVFTDKHGKYNFEISFCKNELHVQVHMARGIGIANIEMFHNLE